MGTKTGKNMVRLIGQLSNNQSVNAKKRFFFFNRKVLNCLFGLLD